MKNPRSFPTWGFAENVFDYIIDTASVLSSRSQARVSFVEVANILRKRPLAKVRKNAREFTTDYEYSTWSAILDDLSFELYVIPNEEYAKSKNGLYDFKNNTIKLWFGITDLPLKVSDAKAVLRRMRDVSRKKTYPKKLREIYDEITRALNHEFAHFLEFHTDPRMIIEFAKKGGYLKLGKRIEIATPLGVLVQIEDGMQMHDLDPVELAPIAGELEDQIVTQVQYVLEGIPKPWRQKTPPGMWIQRLIKRSRTYSRLNTECNRLLKEIKAVKEDPSLNRKQRRERLVTLHKLRKNYPGVLRRATRNAYVRLSKSWEEMITEAVAGKEMPEEEKAEYQAALKEMRKKKTMKNPDPFPTTMPGLNLCKTISPVPMPKVKVSLLGSGAAGLTKVQKILRDGVYRYKYIRVSLPLAESVSEEAAIFNLISLPEGLYTGSTGRDVILFRVSGGRVTEILNHDDEATEEEMRISAEEWNRLLKLLRPELREATVALEEGRRDIGTRHIMDETPTDRKKIARLVEKHASGGSTVAGLFSDWKSAGRGRRGGGWHINRKRLFLFDRSGNQVGTIYKTKTGRVLFKEDRSTYGRIALHPVPMQVMEAPPAVEVAAPAPAAVPEAPPAPAPEPAPAGPAPWLNDIEDETWTQSRRKRADFGVYDNMPDWDAVRQHSRYDPLSEYITAYWDRDRYYSKVVGVWHPDEFRGVFYRDREGNTRWKGKRRAGYIPGRGRFPSFGAEDVISFRRPGTLAPPAPASAPIVSNPSELVVDYANPAVLPEEQQRPLGAPCLPIPEPKEIASNPRKTGRRGYERAAKRSYARLTGKDPGKNKEDFNQFWDAYVDYRKRHGEEPGELQAVNTHRTDLPKYMPRLGSVKEIQYETGDRSYWNKYRMVHKGGDQPKGKKKTKEPDLAWDPRTGEPVFLGEDFKVDPNQGIVG